MSVTAIADARVFDGVRPIPEITTVVVDRPRISAIGDAVPDGATVVDAAGAPSARPLRLPRARKSYGVGVETLPRTPTEGRTFVDAQIAAGADDIKVMIEEGSVLGAPNLPEPGDATLRAAVEQAHEHGKMVLAHTLTARATRTAIGLGVAADDVDCGVAIRFGPGRDT